MTNRKFILYWPSVARRFFDKNPQEIHNKNQSPINPDHSYSIRVDKVPRLAGSWLIINTFDHLNKHILTLHRYFFLGEQESRLVEAKHGRTLVTVCSESVIMEVVRVCFFLLSFPTKQCNRDVTKFSLLTAIRKALET